MPDGAASLRPAALRGGRRHWMTRLRTRGLRLRALRRQPRCPDRFRRFGRMEAPWAHLAQRFSARSLARIGNIDLRSLRYQVALSITHLSQTYSIRESAHGEAATGHQV